ncbi:MAG: hypothetical protein EAZ08_05950 [Cytophagales bacterium]|nr:MAG: hypothetical protein EAZ08_05950 [Cytophagales bacterium]
MIRLLIFAIVLLSQANSFAQTVLNDSLRKELEAIYAADQQPRHAVNQIIKQYGIDSPQLDSLGQFIRKTDSLNQAKVEQIIQKYGWLGKSEVGDMANQTLFLIIQHSDIAIQEKYLPLLRKSVSNEESNTYDLALMEDKVLISQGKKQLYGTQVKRNPQTKQYEVLPIEDEKNIDKRRKKMGMDSLAEYLKGFGITYK